MEKYDYRSKILYFESAGMATEDSIAVGVGSCRIRTAFHAKGGKLVYLEMTGHRVLDKKSKNRGKVRGWVDFAHYITNSGDDCNLSRIKDVERKESFDYSPDGILEIVRKCGGEFDAVQVLPDLAGYRVHKERGERGPTGYNYGDEFNFDKEKTAKREAIRAELYRLEYAAREKDIRTGKRLFARSPSGGIYPCFSLWVPEDNPNALFYVCHTYAGNFEAVIYLADGSAKDCILAAFPWTADNYGDFSDLF